MKTYKLHVDNGHAWLEVPISELDKLGIYDQISRCSYQRVGIAYLEEDCDMPLFLNKLGEKVQFEEIVYNGLAPLRNFPHFFG